MSKIKNKLKPINAPVFRYRDALYRAFYSKNLYVDVGKRWHGLGLRYLLMILAICSLPLGVKLSFFLNQSLENQILEPLKQLPTLYIQNGIVYFDKPMPYFIKDNEGKIVLIVDTTGQINRIDSTYPDVNVLLTKDSVSYRIPTPEIFNFNLQSQSQNTVTEQHFDKDVNLVFNGKKIVSDNTVWALKVISQLLVYPMLVVTLYSLLVVFFLSLALLGQVFSRIFFSFKIYYACASRLLIVSSTPMLLALNFFLAANWVFMSMGLLLIGLLLLYYSFALFSLKSESKRVALR